MRLIKLANYFETKLPNVELKKHRKDLDSDKVESLVDKALADHEGKDIDLSYNNQHYGWFVWDPQEKRHEQRDMNNFEADDQIKDVRKFVSDLTKAKLEKYE